MLASEERNKSDESRDKKTVNENGSGMSPPEPESAPVLAPLTVDDMISMDTSRAHKVPTDDVSLIVNVDDTQSELDGDLDTSTTASVKADKSPEKTSSKTEDKSSTSRSDAKKDGKEESKKESSSAKASDSKTSSKGKSRFVTNNPTAAFRKWFLSHVMETFLAQPALDSFSLGRFCLNYLDCYLVL